MTDPRSAWRVSYHRSVEYELVKCRNVLDPDNDALLSVGRRNHTRRFVVVDENVERLHAAEIRDYFGYHEVDARIVTFPGGEPNKSVDGYLSLLNALDSFPIDRREEPIIVIGGGVVTDLVGFVAGTYRRGVPHIKVPTTLIGYVDAAVGIKTGVNLNCHKNRLGSFEAPRKVFLDAAFLETLPLRHILNGVCEILKLALIADRTLFDLLEAHGSHCIETKFQDETGTLLLDRAVQGMIDELQPNLFEDDLARRVDFGHTFIYGLETHADFDCLHGEAVLMDILVSASLAVERDLLSSAELRRMLALVHRLGLVPNSLLLDPDLLWESLGERTLHRGGWQRLPLPHGIGSCVFVNDVRLDEVRSACHEMLETCKD